MANFPLAGSQVPNTQYYAFRGKFTKFKTCTVVVQCSMLNVHALHNIIRRSLFQSVGNVSGYRIYQALQKQRCAVMQTCNSLQANPINRNHMSEVSTVLEIFVILTTRWRSVLQSSQIYSKDFPNITSFIFFCSVLLYLKEDNIGNES